MLHPIMGCSICPLFVLQNAANEFKQPALLSFSPRHARKAPHVNDTQLPAHLEPLRQVQGSTNWTPSQPYNPLPQSDLDSGDDKTLPEVSEIIHSPISAQYLFHTIPSAARPALARLLMKVLSQCNTMAAQPLRSHDALVTLHMIP